MLNDLVSDIIKKLRTIKTISTCANTTTHGASERHKTITIDYTVGNSETDIQTTYHD
jgi:hypothetical protein